MKMSRENLITGACIVGFSAGIGVAAEGLVYSDREQVTTVETTQSNPTPPSLESRVQLGRVILAAGLKSNSQNFKTYVAPNKCITFNKSYGSQDFSLWVCKEGPEGDITDGNVSQMGAAIYSEENGKPNTSLFVEKQEDDSWQLTAQRVDAPFDGPRDATHEELTTIRNAISVADSER